MEAIVESAWAVPLAGLLCGLVLGAVARRRNLCTLTSLERHWYSDDSIGLRTWALAALVALIATQFLWHSGTIDLQESFYLSAQINLVNIIVGGLMFGFGMALVGTCGFGALIRLGSGSLRSLVIVLAMGLMAVSAQRGTVGALREWSIAKFAHTLPGSQSLPDLLFSIGIPDIITNLLIVIALLCAMFWVFKAQAFRDQKAAISTGVIIGCCIAFGWYATATLQHYQFEAVQLEAGSFVLPPGELIFHAIFFNGIPDYGVGLVAGVLIGAFIVSLAERDIRWEACDDARELSRHLAGGLLMGAGGVFASGCTIGQGISAFSVLAISAPVAIVSIMIGARMGLSYLIEGSPWAFTKNSAAHY
jgi:uncharacterized membrane protein YedE/YeeE